MENSAYVPNSGHLNSPALVVFSQAAAGGLQDALRIQRPFNPQFAMSEAPKDLHRPFGAANFGLRHMEAYGGLQAAHILNHLQPQFLHPGLTLGSGAFRPLGDLKATFPSPSAFAPPKCLKIETNTGDQHHHHHNHHQHHHQQGQTATQPVLPPPPPSQQLTSHMNTCTPNGGGEERYLPRATDSCSPASASLSPQSQTTVKEESLDAHEDGTSSGGGGGGGSSGGGGCGGPDSDSPNLVHDETRGFRIGPLFGNGFGAGGGPYTFTVPGLPPAAHALSKTSFLFDHHELAKKKRDPSSCPICGMTISPGDLESHFMQELEILCKISGTGIAATRKRRHEQQRPPALPGDTGPEGRWETFQRIKLNRQGRLRVKMRKRKPDDCMICIGRLHRSPEDVHGEQCRKNSLNEEDETVDVEGDSELEEWAETQRKRTNSLSSNPVNPIGSSTTTTSTTTTVIDTDDVVVDGDEGSVYGPSQYTDSDVLRKCGAKEGEMHSPPNSENIKIEGSGQQSSQVATVNSSGDVSVSMEIIIESDSNVSTSDAEPSSRTQMIEELRNRIRPANEGETATSTEIEDYKCLICLEHYRKPVISTVCWHVHCEDCWLHALGIKNICPQCSMITSPTDLRRIFM